MADGGERRFPEGRAAAILDGTVTRGDAVVGRDLPEPHEPFTIDTWMHRWPSGAEKAELFDGIMVFSGEFDERDVQTAQRAFPERQILLNDSGGVEIHPASDEPPRSIFETFAERLSRHKQPDNTAS